MASNSSQEAMHESGLAPSPQPCCLASWAKLIFSSHLALFRLLMLCQQTASALASALVSKVCTSAVVLPCGDSQHARHMREQHARPRTDDHLGHE